MSSQLWMRRLNSKPVIVTLSSILVFVFVIFASYSSITPSRALGSHSHSSSALNDILNATLGFQNILVVGLPSRTDRRDAMTLSAALNNIEVEFVDGVLGETMLESALPALEPNIKLMGNSSRGSWRGHMNAVQEIVRRNLTSALIFEDDVDWDIRWKEQLRDFALSSQTLLQPLSSSPLAYADPTYPKPIDPSQSVADISFHHMPETLPPTTSPYGDNWDILWLGHCGMNFAQVPGTEIPKGRIVRIDDNVPQKKYLETVTQPDELKEQYPDHSRVVHHVQGGICSLAYALSQSGARKLLYGVGLNHSLTDAYDIMLRHFCEGTGGQKYHRCLTVVPSLFHHHRVVGPKSAESDISPHGSDFRDKAFTPVIRWSQRTNWDALLEGRTDFVDQWPDG